MILPPSAIRSHAFFAQKFNCGFLLFRHHGCILLVLISTAEDTP